MDAEETTSSIVEDSAALPKVPMESAEIPSLRESLRDRNVQVNFCASYPCQDRCILHCCIGLIMQMQIGSLCDCFACF